MRAKTRRVEPRAVRGLVVLALWGLVGCSSLSDWIEAAYPTTAEAERAGLITRGWVPPILPPSATDINDLHNIDTDFTYACFSVPLRDLAKVRELIDRAGGTKAGSRSLPSPPPRHVFWGRVAWWPQALERPVDEVYELREEGQHRVVVGVLQSGRVCLARPA